MTRKRRLLIIDDQLTLDKGLPEVPRVEDYNKLEDSFDLVFLEKPSALAGIIDHRLIDAALIDFVLDDWEIDISAILKTIDGRVPVSLISNLWTPNFDKLRVVMDNYDISRLFTWSEMSTPQGRDLVSFWIDMTIRQCEKTAPKSLDDDEPFRLVQISDLQFGAAHPRSFTVDTELALQSIQTRWDAPPQVLALTGDIAEFGRPAEFASAEEWVQRFQAKLSRSTSVIDVMTVPGNHDLSWPLALSSRVNAGERTLDKDAVLVPELLPYVFAPYRKFSGNVEPSERWSNGRHYWVSGRHKHSGIIFFGVNTCESVDEWGVETKELVDQTIADLFSEIRDMKRDFPTALVVGMLHHPLVAPKDAITNSELLRKNLTEELGTVVLLNGHVHFEEAELLSGARSGFLQVLAPTFSLLSDKRDEDTSRGFNLIEMRRTEGIVSEIEITAWLFDRHGVKLDTTSVFQRRPDGMLSRK